MTPNEAIVYAEKLSDEDRMTRNEVTRRALLAVFQCTSTATKRRAMAGALRNAEYFRSSSVPGHTTWYPHHLQIAAVLADVLGHEHPTRIQ